MFHHLLVSEGLFSGQRCHHHYNQRSGAMWEKMRGHIQALIDGSDDHIGILPVIQING